MINRRLRAEQVIKKVKINLEIKDILLIFAIKIYKKKCYEKFCYH